jgi:hypothetical protein
MVALLVRRIAQVHFTFIGGFMSLIERAKKICLTPRDEWKVIAGETTPTSTLLTGYVLPLAAVSAVAGFIGGSVVGHSLPFMGTYRVPFFSGLVLAAFSVAMAVVSVFVLSAVITALAPTFGGQKDGAQAMKLAVYAYTPAWIAGALQILPALGVLAALAGLYGLYVLYLGISTLMRCPPEKALPYTAVVVVVAIILTVVLGAIGGTIAGGAGALTGARVSSAPVQFDRDSPMGKLQQLGQELEKSGRKMDAAKASGDAKAEAAAATEALGTLLGGGQRVEPVQVDQLKPFLPETFAALPRKGSSAERSGAAGLQVSAAHATYGEASRRVQLDVTDSGGAGGLVGLAAWANVQSEREDEQGTERTQTVGGRVLHEQSWKRDGSAEVSVIVAKRFIVKAAAQGVPLADLRGAVSGLDLAKLEGLK